MELFSLNQHESTRSGSKAEKQVFLCINNRKIIKDNMKATRNKSKMRSGRKPKQVVHPSSIRLLTDATWDFAHSILWSRYPFSRTEIELSKLFIREYYQQIPIRHFTDKAYKHFKGYCKRILLAKNYVTLFYRRYIPRPCIWFNKRNPKGFGGTKVQS